MSSFTAAGQKDVCLCRLLGLVSEFGGKQEYPSDTVSSNNNNNDNNNNNNEDAIENISASDALCSSGKGDPCSQTQPGQFPKRGTPMSRTHPVGQRGPSPQRILPSAMKCSGT